MMIETTVSSKSKTESGAYPEIFQFNPCHDRSENNNNMGIAISAGIVKNSRNTPRSRVSNLR